MRYRNAAKGIRKLWVAELLTIISTVLTLVFALLLVTNGLSNGNTLTAEDLTDAQANAVVISSMLVILTLILNLISFILGVVGTYQGQKDEHNFLYALAMLMLGFTLSAIASMLGETMLSQYIRVLSDIVSGWMLYSVMLAVSEIASKLGREELQTTARQTGLLVACAVTACEIVQLSALILPDTGIAATLTVVTAIVEICVYVYYLIVLTKGKSMLAR